VIAALVQADGNISAAARGLGLHRTQLRRLLTRYDVDPDLVRGATRR
jgi:ActR/RegA family two-component response regulator